MPLIAEPGAPPYLQAHAARTSHLVSQRLFRTAEIAGGAFLASTLARLAQNWRNDHVGADGQPDKTSTDPTSSLPAPADPFTFLGMPTSALAAAALYAVSAFGLAGEYDSDVANLADGALAAYIAGVGVTVGDKEFNWRGLGEGPPSGRGYRKLLDISR